MLLDRTQRNQGSPIKGTFMAAAAALAFYAWLPPLALFPAGCHQLSVALTALAATEVTGFAYDAVVTSGKRVDDNDHWLLVLA